ncbi:MAG: TolC family protein [Kofleriaceae bacterium]
MRWAVVVLAALVIAAPASADDVTFSDVTAAVDRAPASRASVLDVTAAEARTDAAGAWNPTNLRVGTNRLTARLVAGLIIPLPILGTLGAARDEASAQATVVRDDAIVARRDLRQRAIVAWLELSRADTEILTQTAAANQAAELERIAKGRFDAGAGGEVDATTAHAAKARADVGVAAAKRESSARAADLAALLGWDPAIERHASGPLPGGVAELEQLRASLAHHPEHAAALAQILARQATEHRLEVARRPGLGFEVTVSYDDISQGYMNDPIANTDVYAGLSFDLPLFAHLGDQLRAARAETNAAQVRLSGVDAQLAAELVAAYRRWQAATERVGALEHDVLPAQQRATQLAEQAFREGARDLSTALQATRDLQAIDAELANARIESGLAWQVVVIAAGVSDAR